MHFFDGEVYVVVGASLFAAIINFRTPRWLFFGLIAAATLAILYFLSGVIQRHGGEFFGSYHILTLGAFWVLGIVFPVVALARSFLRTKIEDGSSQNK